MEEGFATVPVNLFIDRGGYVAFLRVTSSRASGHDNFVIDPADLGVVLGEPIVPEEHLGLAQVDDRKFQNFGVGYAVRVVHEEFNLDIVRDTSCAVGGSIGIPGREGDAKRPGGQLVGRDKRGVYARDSAPAV
jgi:hypothetical protein